MTAAELFSYQFFYRALAAAALASISCGIIGTYIVSRRMVFMSGGISHASFGGIGMAYYFGFDPIIGAAAFAVACSAGIDLVSRRASMRVDSLIGVIWSFGMAVGIIFVYITPGYAPDLMSYLFGSILTVTDLHLLLMVAVSLAVVIIFSLFFREILFIAFDEEFSLTRRLPVRAINYLVLGLTALVIVLCIRVAGIILVISLLTIPQAAASIFTGEFRKIIALSVIIGLFSSVSGLLISAILDVPSGAAIIFTSVLVFAVLRTVKFLWTRASLRRELGA